MTTNMLCCPFVLLSMLVIRIQAESSNFVAFNTGLLASDSAQQQRKNKIIAELKNLSADTICLQEIWYSSDVIDFVTQLKDDFPYSYSYLHEADGTLRDLATNESACTESEYTPYRQCLIWKCARFLADFRKFSKCVIESCGRLLLAMTNECRTCLGTTKNHFLPNYCVSSGLNNKYMNIFGNLILSNKKITYGTVHAYDGNVPLQQQLEIRGFLEVFLDGVEGPVACTHLSATSVYTPFYEPNLPYYSSSEERNLGQTKEILKYYANKANVVLMGHFNSGPAGPNITAYHPMSWEYIAEFVPPLQPSFLDKCTWCADNPRISAGEVKENNVVDFVFVRGHVIISSERVLDSEPLSDLYGVSALVDLVTN